MNSSLVGKSIVVTRALHQADELNILLRSRGAVPLLYPCIAIVPPEDTAPLDAALREAASGAYDWLILTSSNTVVMLAERLKVLGLPRLQGLKVAAVGEATAQSAQTYLGLQADLVPQDQNAKAVGDLLASELQKGTRILLPQSDIALAVLGKRLAEMSISVTVLSAYRTVIGSGGDDIPALLRDGQVDIVTFTSPSTVDNFLKRLTNEGGQLEHLTSVPLACIGTVTAHAAEAHGLHFTITPAQQTIAALVEALEDHFAVERL